MFSHRKQKTPAITTTTQTPTNNDVFAELTPLSDAYPNYDYSDSILQYLTHLPMTQSAYSEKFTFKATAKLPALPNVDNIDCLPATNNKRCKMR